MKLNEDFENAKPVVGSRYLWEVQDDLAIRILQVLETWTAEETRQFREAMQAASGTPLNVLIAGSIAGTLRQDFVVETKRLWVRSGKDRWYRKLARAFQRAFWALACWNV